MTYSMPELVALTPAVEAVQGTDKGILSPPDAHNLLVSMGAYEADE